MSNIIWYSLLFDIFWSFNIYLLIVKKNKNIYGLNYNPETVEEINGERDVHGNHHENPERMALVRDHEAKEDGEQHTSIYYPNK